MRYSRFRFLKWPLGIFEESEEIRRADFPIPEEAKSRKFPIRARRYWWISCAVQEELQSRHSPPVIADVGCGGGMLKRFIPPIEGAHWIGLDFRYQKERMEIAKYDRFLECDFDRTLPLPDSAADIVMCWNIFPAPNLLLRSWREYCGQGACC
jgi:SAM-dependent methyltransferase